MKFIEWLIGHVWPPTHPDPRQHQWQIGITMLGLFTALGMIAVAMAGANQIPGVAGYAQQSDVARLQSTAKSIEIRIVSADLYEARREQCQAIAENDGQSKPGPLRRINALMADYQSMTGFAYRLPECEEI